MAETLGFRLVKSRRRDPAYVDYGLWWLLPLDSEETEPLRVRDGMTIDQLEHWLTTQRRVA